MKNLISIFLILTSICGFSQSNEDEILYSIIVNDSTSTRYMDPEYESLKNALKGLRKETFDSFIEQNKASSKLGIDLKMTKEIVFITKQEKAEIFTNGKGWFDFYEKYEDAQGILSLSKIGLNKTKTQALLYYGNQSDGLAGAGFLVLFEKINGVWEKKDSIMLWIS